MPEGLRNCPLPDPDDNLLRADNIYFQIIYFYHHDLSESEREKSGEGTTSWSQRGEYRMNEGWFVDSHQKSRCPSL
jgi:hypothetical protein